MEIEINEEGVPRDKFLGYYLLSLRDKEWRRWRGRGAIMKMAREDFPGHGFAFLVEWG